VRANDGLAGSLKVVRNGILHCVNASFDTSPEGVDGVTHNQCSTRTWLLATGGPPPGVERSRIRSDLAKLQNPSGVRVPRPWELWRGKGGDSAKTGWQGLRL
jgi:hypothetical protein